MRPKGHMVSAVLLGAFTSASLEAGIFVIDKPVNGLNSMKAQIKRNGSLSPKLEGCEVKFAITEEKPIKIHIELKATRKMADGSVKPVNDIPLLKVVVTSPGKSELLSKGVSAGESDLAVHPLPHHLSHWRKQPGLPLPGWDPWLARFTVLPLPGVTVEAQVSMEWATPMLTLFDESLTVSPNGGTSLTALVPLKLKGTYFVNGSSRQTTGSQAFQPSLLTAGRPSGTPWATREGADAHSIVFAVEPPAISNESKALLRVLISKPPVSKKLSLRVRVSPDDPFLKTKRL